MATNNLSYVSKDFNFLKFGSATIQASQTFVDVSMTLPSNYYVILSPSNGIGISVFVSNKTTSGFRINSVSAPVSNMNVDYIVIA